MVGVTRDTGGKDAYRLALQTREQHIRRDKATSNICTAQALLANMSAMYAVYHGPHGIKDIATRVHYLTIALAEGLQKAGNSVENEYFFDTITVLPKHSQESVRKNALQAKINLRYCKLKVKKGLLIQRLSIPQCYLYSYQHSRYNDDGSIGLSLDETTTIEDVNDLLKIFGIKNTVQEIVETGVIAEKELSKSPFKRTTNYLTHPVFNSHHSETRIVRYMKSLENKDVSLVHSMIPLVRKIIEISVRNKLFMEFTINFFTF